MQRNERPYSTRIFLSQRCKILKRDRLRGNHMRASVKSTIVALVGVTPMRHMNRMMALVLALFLIGCAQEAPNKNESGVVAGGRDTNGVKACVERELKARLSASDWENRAMTGMSETETFDFMKRVLPAAMRANGACGLPDENIYTSGSMMQCTSTLMAGRDISPSQAQSLCICAEKELKTHISAADWERSTLLDMNDKDMGEYMVRMMRATFDATQVCMKK